MPRLPALVLLCWAFWAVPASALTLSETERDWLAAHPQLRLGIDSTWPPFEFRDAQGHYQGLSADYIRVVEQRLGIRLEPVEPSDWSEVLKQVRTGGIDLLPGIMATPEREQYLAFTRPYLDFPIVILARVDGPQPHSLDSLKDLTVAVIRDYAPHELLRKHHPELRLLALPNAREALQALATGRADAFVGDLASSAWSLRQLHFDGLLVTAETPYRYQLAMAVPREHAVLAGIIDKVFLDLDAAELAALQTQWVGGMLDTRTPWHELLVYGLPGLLALIGVIGVILLINRRLSREMSRRAALELQLRDSEQHYRGLVESLSAIAWEARPSDFCFTYASPHAEKLLGYPLTDWLQPGFWQRVVHPDDAQRVDDFCRRESAAGRDHSLDHRMLAADGRVVWVRDISTLSRHGDVTVLRGLMIDISEAKETEQALHLSELKFASVFHHCPDILVIARGDNGRLLALNRAFELQFGIAAADALGKTATELGLWGQADQGPQLLQRLQGNNLRNLELPFRRRDGQGFTGLLSAERIALDGSDALVLAVRDISELKETQLRLQNSEERFAKAFYASPDGLLITRLRDGLLIEANQGFSRITGYSAEQASQRSTLELRIWADPEDRMRLVQRVAVEGLVRDFTAFIRTTEGLLRLCELSAQPINIGGEPCMLTIARDITERQQMQEKLLQAATVFESTAEGVMITDLAQRITAVNRAFSEITGYSEAEALGQSPRLLASGQHDSAFYAAMWHRLAAEGHWQGEIWNRRKNGEAYPEWLTINAVKNGKGAVSHFVGVFADISTLKQAQARLDHQAHHDPLTGLPNRLLFENRLRSTLNDAQAGDCQGAVLFLDLDRFKHINDSLGHPVGDLLLKSIAKRLREQLRDIDTVARLGGDEFIILLPGLHQKQDAELIASKLLTSFNLPFQSGEHDFFISVSIGISLFPEDGLDVATLVKNADAAMYRSKARGRNRVEFYTCDLTTQASERMALENELRRALERNELSLHYQPKLALHDHRLVGAEALVRWRHPVFGEVTPERFIPLAEENGLILPLGDWVLQEACRQMGDWQRQYVTFGPLSINLAGAQLRQSHLVGRIRQLLEDAGLTPDQLQLEITENFIMSQTEEALGILHELKALGVQLAIDDFGTGYSSLSYLKRLPLDILKIDQSFVRGLPEDHHDAAITRAIIALGRSMQLTVIAEGVETLSQQQFLAAEGCEQIQGYLISRPLPAADFAATFLVPWHSIGTTATPPV
ncbi:MAG: EAL domain-containing protein [Pseudomonas sp.]|uniref:bifunctional diguanylate cyclase/phosphodiesterase n=1 Tax=Pseudomonas sp. TaxID=306 RepID=UPI0033988E17